jgi:hypothetical protein
MLRMRPVVGFIVLALALACALTVSISPDSAQARKRCREVRAHGATAT